MFNPCSFVLLFDNFSNKGNPFHTNTCRFRANASSFPADDRIPKQEHVISEKQQCHMSFSEVGWGGVGRGAVGLGSVQFVAKP